MRGRGTPISVVIYIEATTGLRYKKKKLSCPPTVSVEEMGMAVARKLGDPYASFFIGQLIAHEEAVALEGITLANPPAWMSDLCRRIVRCDNESHFMMKVGDGCLDAYRAPLTTNSIPTDGPIIAPVYHRRSWLPLTTWT
jgi:hypothetical protein